jgi:Ca-activated chloride channel family protein
MRFLLPTTLLWAIPVVAAIIILYLFRLRRRDQRVSSLMLWGQALREMQANAPFRRLRANWLMAVQILAVIALVAALARPYRTVPGVSGKCVAVVLDASASMRATDVKPSRFDRAKAEAATLIDGLGRDDSMCVVVAGAPTRVAAPLTSDKSVLRKALQLTTATDCPTRPDEAVRLALSLVRGRSGGRVVVLSDGGFGDVGAAADPSTISFVRIGDSDDNVGIVALDARPGPDNRMLALASVRNFSQRQRSFDLEVRSDGSLADVQRMSLAPGQEMSRVFGTPQGASQITVRVDVKDAFAPDNEAHLLLGAGKQGRGVLLTKEDLFLQKALAIDPRVAFVRATSLDALSTARFDVYVLDGMCPDKLPRHTGVLFIAAANSAAPVTVTGEISGVEVTRWERDHPITRSVDFSGLMIEKAQKVTTRDWARPLVYARDTPLVVAGEHEGTRAVYIAWNLLDSDFVLRVGFPIFIGNCMQWLMGDSGGPSLANQRTGDVFVVAPPVDRASVDLIMPGGRRESVPLLHGTAAVRLDRVGVYEARLGSYHAFAAANLLDAGESTIAPRQSLVIGAKQVTAVGRRPRRTQEYWRWAVLAVLALFTTEWLMYHRRI